MDEFEVTTDGGASAVGPVTLDQVRRGLAAGKIPATAQIRRVGEEAWHPVLASLTWEAKPTAAPAVPPEVPPQVATPSVTQDPRIANWMQLAAAATDAGNRDEAYRYFTKVLEFDASNYEAWFGKALAAGWGSGLRGDRFSELVSGIDRAIGLAPEDTKKGLSKRAAAEIKGITRAYLNLSISHTAEYISLDDTWEEHVARCIQILAALEAANRLDPANKTVIENAIELTKSMIEGVQYEDKYESESAYKTKYKHLPPNMEAQAKSVMAEFVKKLQALDPNYKAPEISKAGEIGAGCWIGCFGIVVLLGLGGWWGIKNFLGRASDDRHGSRSDSTPQTDVSVKASATQALPEEVPATVTAAWCASLARHIEPRLLADARRKYAGQRDDAYLKRVVGEYVKNLTYNCSQAVGQPTSGEWACYWDAGFDSYKDCEKLRVSAPTHSSGGGSKKDKPAVSEDVKVVPNCTECSSQEDFDAAMKAGSKCCPVMACTSNVECYPRRGETPGRICCKIPGGQLCADPDRCKGSNRVEP